MERSNRKSILMVIASNTFRNEECSGPCKALEAAGAQVVVTCSLPEEGRMPQKVRGAVDRSIGQRVVIHQ